MKFQIMLTIKNKIETIANIKTVKIGLEKGIGARDCPFIRVVNENSNPASNNSLKDDFFIQIIFGFNTTNIDSLEEVYQSVFDLETKIKEVIGREVNECIVSHKETLYDGDTVPNLKVSVMRFKIQDIGSY